MDKLMQEAPESLRGRMFRQDTSRPKEKQILVLKTGIAGAQFHIESEEEQTALDSLSPGTELLLYREPENEYDEWAIAVYLTEEDKIGFISRFKNETIARLMDAGKKFVAITDDPTEIEDIDEHGRRKGAPTENMAIPVSIYLVEQD